LNSLKFDEPAIEAFIVSSLAEDIGSGDHSSLSCIDFGARGRAKLLFKDDGVVAGIDLAKQILLHLDPYAEFSTFNKDGDSIKKGDIGFIVDADVHAILSGERLLLNCMQRLSGIATATHQLVRMVAHTNVKLLDTRKTTPGLRTLEKWAVTMGGGHNHRIGLYDMIMLKDNHIDYAGGITRAVERVKKYLAEKNLDLKIEVETRNIDEVRETLSCGGVHRIMLDNYSPSEIREVLPLIDGACETEASGGINQSNLVSYAETGVDFISMGALTHSVKSLDISLKQIED
jgi:nicotinate-nucleotide pyrophosphorylase (carboxylating)